MLGGLYTSAHVLIENTLVQHKMVKNLCMALCCQNQEYRGYGLHSSASNSCHSTSVTVIGLLKKEEVKKKELVQNGIFCRFQDSYLKTL